MYMHKALTICSAFIAISVLTMPTDGAAHDVAAEVNKVQIAAERYRDVNVALAEGFVPAPPGHCISAASEGLPPGLGGMGIHYINPGMLKIMATEPRVDGKSTHTDFMKPSILLYEPKADGSLELVGIENLVFIRAWKEAGNSEPPSFAGRTWDKMADDPRTKQDEAHMFEPHFDQHVYFRSHASAEEQLKPFSPTVSCQYFTMK